MNAKVIITLLAVIAAMIGTGLSIKCYVCNSFEGDSNCENPGIGTHFKECEPDEKFCRKVEQEINIDGDDTTRVFRSCAKTGPSVNGDCLERTGTYRFKSWYCECTGDKCNSATSSQVSMLAMSISAALGFLVKKLV